MSLPQNTLKATRRLDLTTHLAINQVCAILLEVDHDAAHRFFVIIHKQDGILIRADMIFNVVGEAKFKLQNGVDIHLFVVNSFIVVLQHAHTQFSGLLFEYTEVQEQVWQLSAGM